MKWITNVRAISQKVLFNHLLGHGSRYFQERFSGALTNKISNASNGIAEILMIFLWEFMSFVSSFTITFIVAWIADYRLGIFYAVWTAVYLSINGVLVYKKQPAAFRVASTSSLLRGHMVDTLSQYCFGSS